MLFLSFVNFTFVCFLFYNILVDVSSYDQIAPKLEEFKSTRSLNVGSKFSMFCSPHEGTKPFRFEWFKNGHYLPVLSVTDSKYRIETSEGESLFIIEKLIQTDSGNYSCSVKSNFGSDSQFTVLTVKG